jgi:hypothetical protein
MTTTLVSGLVALALGGMLWGYLRVKSRQLHWGLYFLDDFGNLSAQLVEREMPERELRSLVALTHYTGTGHISRYLFSQLLSGRLASPPSRDAVAAWRKNWSSYNSATRVLYVRTFYSALRADSYFAGPVVGTLFRRAVFYLNSDPAEIAKAVDAMETKILVLGAERAVEREAQRRPDPEPKAEMVTATGY